MGSGWIALIIDGPAGASKRPANASPVYQRLSNAVKQGNLCRCRLGRPEGFAERCWSVFVQVGKQERIVHFSERRQATASDLVILQLF